MTVKKGSCTPRLSVQTLGVPLEQRLPGAVNVIGISEPGIDILRPRVFVADVFARNVSEELQLARPSLLGNSVGRRPLRSADMKAVRSRRPTRHL